MKSIQKSMRLPIDTLKIINQIADESEKDFTTIVKDLLSEAIKMRRCPGIIFTDGINGRRAKIAGTGLGVWEIISTYKSCDQDLSRLQKAYHWLSRHQLNSAIGYYAAYKEEIDQLISRNESWEKGSLYNRYPFLNPEKIQL